MKLKLVLMSLIVSCSMAIYGQDVPNALVFEMKDGSSVTFFYEDQPMLKFTDTGIVVKTDMHETTYPQGAVQRYVFAYRNNSSTDSPRVDDGQVELMGENLTVGRLNPGTRVSLFSVDGKVLAADSADANGNCTISLSSFSAGVYLLNYFDVSVKIVKP